MRVILLALILANSAFAIAHNVWEPPFFNGVAAEVEKTLITYDDVRREMAPLSPQLRTQSKDQADYDSKMESLYKDTLNTLVERALLQAEFYNRYKKGDESFQEEQKRVSEMLKKDTDNEYRHMLKENFNDKTSDLVNALQQEGLTIPAYRKRMEENIIIQTMQQHFRHDLPEITPDQIQSYYKGNLSKFSQSGSIKLSVITLKPMTDEPANVLLQTANEIRQKLVAGEDFSKLAQEHNQEGTIDWDWIATGDLSSELKGALENVKTGEISQPVTVEGPKVLLVKVDDRKNEGVAPLGEVQESIKAQLFEQQAKAAYDKWMGDLQKKYFVKING